MSRLFISQERLDLLVADEHVVVEGDLCLVPRLGTSFPLVPALHFTALVDGDDGLELVGRVKAESWLRSIGADLLLTSAIVGETAYDCMPGFLCDGPAALWAVRELSR